MAAIGVNLNGESKKPAGINKTGFSFLLSGDISTFIVLFVADDRTACPLRIFQIDQSGFNRIQFHSEIICYLVNVGLRDIAIFLEQNT
jgi:hypothetical protein